MYFLKEVRGLLIPIAILTGIIVWISMGQTKQTLETLLTSIRLGDFKTSLVSLERNLADFDEKQLQKIETEIIRQTSNYKQAKGKVESEAINSAIPLLSSLKQ